MNQKRTEVYTDGSCLKNPGRGGWAVLFDDGRQISGGEPATTNNRMELTAVIEALKNANDDEKLILYTDSTYVQCGITSWIVNWKTNGWLTSNKSPVINQDLWRQLDKLSKRRDVKFEWIRGHSGNPMNEDCDYLAKQRANDLDQSIKKLNFPNEIKSLKSDSKESICAEKYIDSVKIVYKSGEYIKVAAEHLLYLSATDIGTTKTLLETPKGLILTSNYIPQCFIIEISNSIDSDSSAIEGVKQNITNATGFLLTTQSIDHVDVNYSDNSPERFTMAWCDMNSEINLYQGNKRYNDAIIIEVDRTIF